MPLCIIDLDPLASRVARRYLTALSRTVPTRTAEGPLGHRTAIEYQRRSDGLEPVGQEDDKQDAERDDDWSTPKGL